MNIMKTHQMMSVFTMNIKPRNGNEHFYSLSVTHVSDSIVVTQVRVLTFQHLKPKLFQPGHFILPGKLQHLD